MDMLETIRTRRSIRKYLDKPVSEDRIRTLLEAAMMAPSAGNQQDWAFVVIDDRKLLDKIPAVHPFSKMVLQAPVAILVCGDLSKEAHKGYWQQDCAAATQNILLAARALGLGTVWLGVYPRQERVDGLRQLLDLPDHVMPLALVPVGYPAEEHGQVDRYDAAKVHRNRW